MSSFDDVLLVLADSCRESVLSASEFHIKVLQILLPASTTTSVANAGMVLFIAFLFHGRVKSIEEVMFVFIQARRLAEP